MQRRGEERGVARMGGGGSPGNLLLWHNTEWEYCICILPFSPPILFLCLGRQAAATVLYFAYITVRFVVSASLSARWLMRRI